MPEKVPTFGQDNFPTETAKSGRRRIGVTSMERCRQCGFVNDTNVAAYQKQGEGLVHVAGDTRGDFQVTGGCGFCGSLNWRSSKRKYPDDTFLADGTIKEEGVINDVK